ncbi:MAG: hypothetical protein AB1779_09085 [Candidatus Thermoplasmatota archaeon]
MRGIEKLIEWNDDIIEQIRRKYEGDDPYVWLTGIKIIVDGVDLAAPSRKEEMYSNFYMDDYIFNNLMEMLNSILHLLNNEKYVFDYQSVPFELHLEPLDDTIKIAYRSPTFQEFNEMPAIPVSLKDLVEEIIEKSEDFLSKALSIQLALSQNKYVRKFKKNQNWQIHFSQIHA